MKYLYRKQIEIDRHQAIHQAQSIKTRFQCWLYFILLSLLIRKSLGFYSGLSFSSEKK